MKIRTNKIRKIDDSEEVVTKGFLRNELRELRKEMRKEMRKEIRKEIRKELRNYPTRVELHEELSKYVTKVEFNERMDEVMTALDGIAGQLIRMEREHAYFVARCERLDAKWENHEKRILTLESHSSPA